MFKEILLSTGVSIVIILSISEIFKEACIHGLHDSFFKYLSNWKTLVNISRQKLRSITPLPIINVNHISGIYCFISI